jgi:hypothetical protein
MVKSAAAGTAKAADARRRGRIIMQPRGQLWFELARVCQDFRDYSGLSEKEALQTLVGVLSNLLSEQQVELERLTSPQAGPVSEEAGLSS